MRGSSWRAAPTARPKPPSHCRHPAKAIATAWNQRDQQRTFMSNKRNTTPGPDPSTRTEDFAPRVRVNQTKLTSQLKLHYDFIVCGSGSSGSVVAGRLAENPEVEVLLLEAGGNDETELVTNPNRWPVTLGTELDWGFLAEPNPQLNGRAIPYSMGKVLGGGSSINVCTWSRGHRVDWDFYASESGDPSWSMASVLQMLQSCLG
jgi:choline dehydrogenase